MQTTNYKMLFEPVTAQKQISAEGCNAILFFNIGSTTAYVNNIPIPAGASISFNGNCHERDTTNYDIRFATGAGSSLSVVRKINEEK